MFQAKRIIVVAAVFGALSIAWSIAGGIAANASSQVSDSHSTQVSADGFGWDVVDPASPANTDG